jgi:hypothetical protein
VRPFALVDAGLNNEGAAQITVVLGVVSFVGDHGADTGHDGEGGEEQALEDDGVVDVGGCGRARDGDAVRSDRDVVLGAALASVGRVGAGAVACALGPHRAGVQDEPGVAAPHGNQQGVHLPSRPVRAQRSRARRSVEPLAMSAVAFRLRHGVPSRRNRRRVATTRIVAAGGWPGPRSGCLSQHSITVATISKNLVSNAVSVSANSRHGYQHRRLGGQISAT